MQLNLKMETEPLISLLPAVIKCRVCGMAISKVKVYPDNHCFYYQQCGILTRWSDCTKLYFSKISLTNIEKLAGLFLSKLTPSQAFNILKLSFRDYSVNKNTVMHYFQFFNQVCKAYYDEMRETIMLQGDIELDESHLYTQKKTQADCRQCKNSRVWMLGFKERDSGKFIVEVLPDRKEDTIIPLINKYIKKGSVLFTDEFSVYVNWRNSKSKLEERGYVHRWIKHKHQFASTLFLDLTTNGFEELWKEINVFQTNYHSKIPEIAIYHFHFFKSLTKKEQILRIYEHIKK